MTGQLSWSGTRIHGTVRDVTNSRGRGEPPQLTGQWEGLVILEPGSDIGTLAGVSPAGVPPAQVGQIATTVAAALDYLHWQGRVHGDVRPSNIVIGPQGQLLLSDGVAPLDPVYAAPERLQGGPVDGRADQYSLACTVFRLLTGRDPFAGADREAVAAAHLGQPVPSVLAVHPYLSPEVDAVIGHAMAKDPRYRYVSCGEFATALAASLAGFSPAPAVAQAYLPSPPRRRGWWVAAALTAAVAVVVVVVVNGDSGGSNRAESAGVTEWDDTLYPQEIPSVFRPLARDELLRPVPTQPEPAWTTPIGDGRPDVVGGDDTIVTLRLDTYLIGLDAATGAPRWPVVDLHDAPMSCAVHENRIGCVASASNGSDSSVFILDAGNGALLKTVKVPNQDLRWTVLAGDRFVVTTDGVSEDDKGFAAGYTTEGDEVWTREGNEGMYAVASQHILVDGTYSGDEVSFVSTEDGREVLRSTRAWDGRDLTWNVFHGGIAVQNEDWTGTDIYDLEGKKKSSVAGWEPVVYQSVYTMASPLPLLGRLKETNYQDDSTIAAANPDTGHLLWRISGSEPTHQIATVDDKMLVKVANPDASSDPTTGPTGREVVRVYDCYSGEPVSPEIDMTGSVSVEVYWIKSDGSQLVYNYIDSSSGYSAVAYVMATGEKAWEIPMAGFAGYPGGAIVAPGEGSVSLFR